ncbi:MAG TPA: hypothetical protein VN577_04305 [Terriglobales bacterium]|nr:hypothetical protein [Terriglobales bacterium]
MSLLLLLFAFPLFAQRGALTRPVTLAQMTEQAATIVRGRVASVEVEPHPEYKHLRTVVVTLRVNKSLKGKAAETLTFRQFIWDVRDVRSAAGYRAGQDLLLFLNRTTEIGLTSPVGLEQGRFRLFTDAQGKTSAVNGARNSYLFTDSIEQGAPTRMSALSRNVIANSRKRPGPVPIEVVEESVQAYLRESGRSQ